MNRIAYLAAPILSFAYGVIRIIDGLDGSRGPGLAWTAGHLAFLAALGFFAWICWDLRRRIGGTGARIEAVAASIGLAAFIAQFAIDIVVGLMAADKPEMSRLNAQIQEIPGVVPVVYAIGPYVFSLGLLALAVHLTLQGKARPWFAFLVLANLVTPAISLDLIPVGAVLLLIAFLPLARQDAHHQHLAAQPSVI